MSVRIVRLGTDRSPSEGLRIGTVRRPPRGVAKSEYSSKNYYDVWLPTLAPSSETVKLAQSANNEREWVGFMRKYRTEMASPGEQGNTRSPGGAFTSDKLLGGVLLS